MARKAIRTERITGPNNEEVVVRFYGDASLRLEVKGGPWSIDQAWLPGGEGANILLRLTAPEEDVLDSEDAAVIIQPDTADTTGT